jgi:hypothetical protein
MPGSGLCRLKRIIPLAGALLSFAVFLLVLRVWEGPSGYDLYYYALQTKALTLHGELLFFDFSLVYYALALVNRLVRNPVLSVQILSSLSMAAIYYCLLETSLRRGFSWYGTAAASIAVFNPASFNLLLEFTKNTFALALFFLSLLLLRSAARPGSETAGETGGKSVFRFFLSFITPRAFFGLLAGLGAVFSHRLMLILGALFLLHRAAGLWKTRRRDVREPAGFPRGAAVAGGGVLLVLLALVLWRKFFADRMPPLDIQAPFHRFLQLSGRRLWRGERIFYPLLQVSLFFLIPWTLIRQRRPFAPASLFGFLAWLCVFPFLRFSWDGLGFRLLIMAPLFAAPWLMERELKSFFRPLASPAKWVPGLLTAGSVFFISAAIPEFVRLKGPDYARYEQELGSLETLAGGRRVIAHRGLAGFLWFEKGIRSENFIPPEEEAGRYLRLVYFFSPETFEPYLRSGESRPVALGGGYTLIEEYIWQRFYHDRRDLQFLKSELNPFLPRPESGFSINEKTSALMTGKTPRVLPFSGLEDEFGSVLKVHGVKVIPLAAPDKTVFFKYPGNGPGYGIFIFPSAGFFPEPVVAGGHRNINRDAEGMGAQAAGARDRTVIERAPRRNQPGVVFGPQGLKFGDDALQLFVYAKPGADQKPGAL